MTTSTSTTNNTTNTLTAASHPFTTLAPLAVLGTGDVAKHIARGLVARGHAVMMAGRDAADARTRLADFIAETGVRVGSYAEAATFGAAAFLAVKGSAAQAVLDAAASRLADKIVIDLTNPIEDAPPEHGVLRFFTARNESLGEQLQTAFPSLRIIKAFNTVGSHLFVRPAKAGSMFMASNHDAAKQEVAVLIGDWGWTPYDVGRIEGARVTEPLCQLWCLPGFLRNDWVHAISMS